MNKLKAKLLHVVLFVFAMLLVVLAYMAANRNRNYKDIRVLSTGWDIKINDELNENVNLEEFSFPIAGKGEWIVMYNKLPEDMGNGRSLRIQMVYSVTKVYVDGVQIFEYGTDLYERGALLGYGTRFIALPEDSAGKNIRITMFVTEDSAFSNINSPEIYNADDAYMVFYGNRMVPFLVSVTLLVVGFCITIVTFCLYFRSYSMNRLFSIGVFSLCVGLWALCSYSLDYIFVSKLEVKACLEFFALYLIPFPALLYFREEVERRKNRWECFAYYMFLIVEIQLYLLTVIFQFTNLGHIPEFSGVFLAFIGVCAAFIIYLLARGFKEEKSHKFLAVGMAVLMVIAIRDIFYSIAARYSWFGVHSESYRSFIPVGALCYVVTLLADFVNEMRKQLFKMAEIRFLEKIAYEDVLTGLYTRRKCDEIFEEIDNSKEPFAIVQYDLNNLKNTNDDYGHEAGDELIIRFTKLLKETFTDGEILGRMGGDEFIAIVKNCENYDVESKFKHFDELATVDNEGKTVKVSASKGYCASSEFEEKPKASAVYKEADKRMYKDKELYYKTTGRGRRRNDVQ